MTSTPSAVATKNRPISSAIVHASPIVLLALAVGSIAIVVPPAKSPAQIALSATATVASTVLVIAWSFHRSRPCQRCISLRDRTGEAGARKGIQFVLLGHAHRMLWLVGIAALVVIVGTGIETLLALSGDRVGATWAITTAMVIAHLLLALLAYAVLCHAAFKQWCKLPHHQREKRVRPGDAEAPSPAQEA